MTKSMSQFSFNLKGNELNIFLPDNTQKFEKNNESLLILGSINDYNTQKSLDPSEIIHRLNKLDFGAFFKSLSGEFILVYIDNDKGIFNVFNDHIGSYPLYYSSNKNSTFISSSLKSLESCQDIHLEVSEQAIFNYVYHHCIPSPYTIYKNIFKLAPGSTLYSEKNSTQSKSIYTPEYKYSPKSESELENECRKIIQKAVAASVTPDTGSFLSGGLDSSTVTGFLAKTTPDAPSFSIGFDAKGYDETEFALITAKHFGTKHQVYYLKPEDVSASFQKVASFFDEPFGNSSAMAAYFCARFAKEHHISHLLAGDGGDEIFAGNERYAKQKQFNFFGVLPDSLKRVSEQVFCNTPLRRLPLFSKIASYIKQANVPLPDRLQTYNFLHQFSPESVFTNEFIKKVDQAIPLNEIRKRYAECPEKHPLERMLYLDWKFTLADNDLIKVRKMCELADVDVSFPLLEKRVVDFSCTVPPNLKLPGQKLRAFFKNAFRDFLANETLTKSKHGFGLPFGVWMREHAELKDIAYDSLESLKKRNVIKPEFIDQTIMMHKQGHSGYYGELIWILSVLEIWMQSRGI